MKGYEENFEESAAYSIFLDYEEDSGMLGKKAYEHYLKDEAPGASTMEEITQVFTFYYSLL